MPFNPQPKIKKAKTPIKQVSDKQAKILEDRKVWNIKDVKSAQKVIKKLKSDVKKFEKKKSTPLTKIKADFDVIYSLVVKMEPANDQGIVRCYCGDYLHWTNANNSHFIQRSTAPSIMFDRMNTHPSCVPCNGFKEGNREAYIPWMNKKYGKDQVELLRMRGHKKSNMGTFEYTVMINEYIEMFHTQCIRLHHTPNVTTLRIINKYTNKHKY